MSLNFRVENPYDPHNVGHPHSHSQSYQLIYGFNTWDLRYHPEFTTDPITGSGFTVTRTSTTTSHPYSESPLDPRMDPKIDAMSDFAFKLAFVPPPVRVWMTMMYVLHEMDN